MGGTMWVESPAELAAAHSAARGGPGSSFHFTVHTVATTAGPVHSYQKVADYASLQGKRVLIVDDNATSRRILMLQTQRWGMIPRETAFPREALAWVQHGEPFDLVLLDYQMPEMDGVMLAQALRALVPATTLPIMLLSSLGQRETDADDNLFAAFLIKPIKAAQLYNVLMGIFSTVAAVPVLTTGPSLFDGTLGARSPLRILLAEDNAVNQKLALRMLERLGYRADVAGNGLEVLDAVQRQPYDVILMDVQMPEMDGLDATRRVREKVAPENQPRIIAMTANALKEDRETCLAAGMNDYLSKPIRVEELVMALQQSACKSRSA